MGNTTTLEPYQTRLSTDRLHPHSETSSIYRWVAPPL